ncbi:MAG: flagellar hook-basal body complex protein FliE [Candidatus Margulisbacteria bacterium]|nr:flagellar hook-basal body complex protein FliE [Candidatus Margulisiibacteriota bacterium]
MAEAIDPIRAEMRLAQILGEDFLAQSPAEITPAAATAEPAKRVEFSGNLFDDVLSKTIEALEGVSRSEVYANQLVDKYLRGEAELQDVMMAQSKMSILMQLAVTTINAAVTTFKEITQMQV